MNGENMRKRKSIFSLTILAFPVIALLFTAFVNAQEIVTGPLVLRETRIKTANKITALPKCPDKISAFTPTTIYCPGPGPCTIEINMTSELSDVSPGVDSLRFYATVDGSALDVLPTTNLGVNSTAKAGQIETGTGLWMKRYVAPGFHIVDVDVCVNDTNADGFVSGYIGDRTLVVRSYSGY
jgi:hypothetical protein